MEESVSKRIGTRWKYQQIGNTTLRSILSVSCVLTPEVIDQWSFPVCFIKKGAVTVSLLPNFFDRSAVLLVINALSIYPLRLLTMSRSKRWKIIEKVLKKRLPTFRPGTAMKDKSRYSRKKKHPKRDEE